MAENTDTKVLLSVDLKATEALKSLADLKLRTDELKKSQKELDTSTEEGRLEFVKLGQEIKALNARSNEYQKEIQNNIKYQQEQEGSLQQLKRELSSNTSAYNKLSESERNAAKGQELQKQISETTSKLKEAEEALGNHRRSVGDYAKAGESLKKEMKDLVNSLTAMKVAGDDNSETYKEMNARLAELKSAYGNAQAAANKMASDTAGLDALKESVGGLVGAFGAYQSVVAANMEVSDEYLEVMKNMQIVATALASLQAITNALKKEGTTRQYLSIAADKTKLATQILLNKEGVRAATIATAQAKAEAAKNVAMGKGNILTKTAAAVQWAWNAAMAANPVLAIVAAITLLITGIGALVWWFAKSNDAERAATKASEAHEKQARKTADTISAINRNERNISNERNNRLREEILEMQKNGATAEEIAKVRLKSEQELRDVSIKAAEERIAAQKDELQSSERNYRAQVRHLDTLKEGSKKYKEQKQKVDELRQSHLELAQTMRDGQQVIIDLNLQSAESAQQAANEREKIYQDNALKMLEAQKKLQDERFKLQDTFQKREFSEQQKYEAEKFASAQKYEQEKLAMQRRFGQITAWEYQTQLKQLEAQERTFQANQTAAANKHYEEKQKEILGLLGDTTEQQISETNEKYAKAIKSLAEMQEPVQLIGQSAEDFEKERMKYKQFMFEKAAIELELAQQQAKEIEAIRQSSLEKQIADIEKTVNEQYKGDLAKFTDNEREKNRVEIEMLNEQIAKKKAAGLEVYEDEAALRSAQNKAIQLQLNTELLQANENAQAIYEAKKKALESERELYKDNADIQLEIAKALADNEKALIDSRIAAFDEWSGKVSELLSSFSDIASANEAAELQRYEESNNAKKEALQKRLDSGLISQREYDKQVADSDKELDKKKAALAMQQAKRQKAMAVMNATLNAAAAIIASLAQSPVAIGPIPNPVGIASLALATVTGVAQVAAAVATPLPKASKGMFLRGKSHAQGGIPIEAEGGEVIINKRSTAMFAPLLSLINEAGGGVPFVSNAGRVMADGGYVARTNRDNGLSIEDMKEAFKEAVREQKIFVAISDINDGQRDFADITETNPNF